MIDFVVQIENNNDEELTEIHNLTDNVVRQYNINIIKIDILKIIREIFYIIILTLICPIILGLCIFSLIYLSNNLNRSYTYRDFMNKYLFEIWCIGFVITFCIILFKSKCNKK